MLTVAQALSLLAASVSPAGVEEVPLERAAGRVLAKEVRSDVDWPPFDTSAMDGYAVRVADAVAGRELPERDGLVGAGSAPPPPLSAGEAVRVMTGAPLPSGTEAIVPVERSARAAGSVRFEITPKAGAHVRRRGESVRAGAALLSAGRRLRPGDVALAALAGREPVEVFRAPRVTVAVTGDEIVRGAGAPGPGRLRDSNGPMLLAECAALGWTALRGPAVPDTPADVARLFAVAGEAEDFLITTGGVSAGDLDLLPPAAAAAGFDILFHRVAMQPGKPIAVGRRGRVWWIGLPGNPVSAAVGFHVFAREALARFEGETEPAAPRVTSLLTRAVLPSAERDRFLDAALDASESVLRVEPLRSSGSHDLAAHGRANALIHVPAGSSRLPEGAAVSCLLLSR
ncbi:MAG: molybdopterin molybdotransferase MoeA [Acidobacteria bacterium]|nr:molybdopterin molybdotransferase MoeA [Acidobacteriota bacterium]MCA1611788.1 molybdopterin molybdotransferase MoeA [Acidobacteriota bacterium]MCA1617444.1 molybdopterin molybdotransferase MoeA [Acidobacteriota bacterium]